MKYLVLGSAGQIGSVLCRFLRSAGHTVLTMDIVNSDSEDLRINNNAILQSLIEQADLVFFLACNVGGAPYLQKYQHRYEFIQDNIKILSNTFEVIKQHNKPIIFASSQMSNIMHSNYGMIKLIGERYTQSVNGLIVKFWNVYGLELDLEKSHVISDFVRQAISDQQIKMLTDGQERRQFLHVDDSARALYLLAQNYAELDKTQEYAVTSFKWTSIFEIAMLVKKQFVDCEIIVGTASDAVQQDVVNHPDPYVLKYWQPSIGLEDGIVAIVGDML